MSLLSRFSEEAMGTLTLAESEAIGLGYAFIGSEHLLLGALAGGGRVTSILAESGMTLEAMREAVAAKSPKGPYSEKRDEHLLKTLGIELSQVKTAVEEEFGPGALQVPPGRPPFTPRSKRTLEFALRLADTAGSNEVSTEHIVLALLEDREGMAARIISEKVPDPSVLKSSLTER